MHLSVLLLERIRKWSISSASWSRRQLTGSIASIRWRRRRSPIRMRSVGRLGIWRRGRPLNVHWQVVHGTQVTQMRRESFVQSLQTLRRRMLREGRRWRRCRGRGWQSIRGRGMIGRPVSHEIGCCVIIVVGGIRVITVGVRDAYSGRRVK